MPVPSMIPRPSRAQMWRLLLALHRDPLTMYLSDIFTISVNLAGLPGLSMPCGYDANNLPIGMQIIGPQFSEEMVLRVGDALERSGAATLRRAAL